MDLYRCVADIQTAEMLKLPVPEIMTEKPITIAVDPTPKQKAYVESLVKRSQDIFEKKVRSEVGNMLCVTYDGRNAALDIRCVNPTAPVIPTVRLILALKRC